MARENRTVIIDEKEIAYVLERKSVKNLNMRIYDGGYIYISANKYITVEQIEQFIREHKHMIEKSRKKNSNKIIGNGLKDYVTGEVLYHLGMPRTLQVEEGWNEDVILEERTIRLVVRDAEDIKHKQRKLNAWRKKQQEEILLGMCKQVAPIFQEKYGVEYPAEIRIKELSSMWGSCRPKQKIVTLNSALIFANEECIRYVVVHEFAHFIEANHSKDFYRVVASVMPDYDRWNKLLNQYMCK